MRNKPYMLGLCIGTAIGQAMQALWPNSPTAAVITSADLLVGGLWIYRGAWREM